MPNLRDCLTTQHHYTTFSFAIIILPCNSFTSYSSVLLLIKFRVVMPHQSSFDTYFPALQLHKRISPVFCCQTTTIRLIITAAAPHLIILPSLQKRLFKTQNLWHDYTQRRHDNTSLATLPDASLLIKHAAKNIEADTPSNPPAFAISGALTHYR